MVTNCTRVSPLMSAKHLSPRLLLATIFCTGGSILVIEVAALRILSPYFGNTIYTFSSVISIVLAALSLGYYYGGQLADTKPHTHVFFSLIFFGGVSTLLLHILTVLLLPHLGFYMPLTWGPLFISLFLFGPPCLLLGFLSPLAVKLVESSLGETYVGRAAGNVFCFGTVGSITGSLLTGFLLIPLFGVREIVFGVGIFLCALGLLGWYLLHHKNWIAIGILLIILIGNSWAHTVATLREAEHLIVQDGIYERITVTDGIREWRPVRYLLQDRTFSSAEFLDAPDEHVFQYTTYLPLYTLASANLQRALFIGGGAYTMPYKIVRSIDDSIVDVTEIEPTLFTIAKQFFSVKDHKRLHNIIADGRRFLHDTENTYDLIYGDAYQSVFSIPAHLTTKEFFDLVYSKLNDGGVFIGNFFGILGEDAPSLVVSEMKAFRAAFPNHLFFALDDPESSDIQHVMFFGRKDSEPIDVCSSTVRDMEAEIFADLCEKVVDETSIHWNQYALLTDNYAPVESMTRSVVKQFAAR